MPLSSIQESHNEVDNTFEMPTPHPVQSLQVHTTECIVKDLVASLPEMWDQKMHLSYMKEV